jgi:predicted transcriptional regulator
MKVNELAGMLKLELIAGATGADSEVKWGYVSDLLSDVMGNSHEGDLWITMQTHLNVVAVAALRDHSAVLFVAGNRPGNEVIEKAEEEGLPLLCTDEPAFDIAGRIHLLLSAER